MPKTQPASTELLADYFVSYLFTKYHGARHVRRIASWIGFIIKAIEKLPGVSLERSLKSHSARAMQDGVRLALLHVFQ